MVAIINHSKSVRDVLNYNERKVSQGKADLILASKFLCEIEDLSFIQKLRRFELLNQLNARTKTNTLHISLNFDRSDEVNIEKLQAITLSYMEQIRLGEQPFLTYQHTDAGHPHVHIVTTIIDQAGFRINTHNIGRLRSEPARKYIEKAFNLVSAEKKSTSLNMSEDLTERASYGQMETKTAIAKVVSYAVKEYRFTSLPELNAVLGLLNVKAENGKEHSYLRSVDGIQYRMQDSNGSPVGVPIKGSSLPGKPTMRSLRKRFEVNTVLRKSNKPALVNDIAKILSDSKCTSLLAFQLALKKERIDLVFRTNEAGSLYGLTYVDHKRRNVFNGSDLGKNFSPVGLQRIFEVNKISARPEIRSGKADGIEGDRNYASPSSIEVALLKHLTEDVNPDVLPYELSMKKNRKKRKRNKFHFMAHQTGENEQALRKILDLTRLLSLALLLIYFYISNYTFFEMQGLRLKITDQILKNLLTRSLFRGDRLLKIWPLMLLAISLIGSKGRKDERISLKRNILGVFLGLVLYFAMPLVFSGDSVAHRQAETGLSIVGYLMMLAAGTKLSRFISQHLSSDVFNDLNETFPQEERLIQNEYSINLPARYNLKGKIRSSWINIVNPFRGLLIIGNPGSGKSYFVIRNIITQHIEKGFSMFLYDFKYDDLTRIAYNQLLRSQRKYSVLPKFYVINFEDLCSTHRCNPLDPGSMQDITDATEASRTIMLGLNREWIKKQGDFFVESPINFLTAVIWYLRKYKDGMYCTLPHVIELMQVNYEQLFPVLMSEPEIEVLVNPFVSAYENDAMEQLEGQIASAKISMARLASPQIYYVLSGNDFTLDINNPKEPKIVAMGNNPQKQQIYGAVLSLYISRIVKLVNRKGQLKCSLIFDEFPTVYFNGIDSMIATARSNKVATTLAIQDYSQLKKDYGREQADVIMNITGNVISGQATGDTAKQLSERFGKIIQERRSISINSSDTSVSRSTQLDSAIPPSTISTLSSGTFVGVVADNPAERIDLKMFHSDIINDDKTIGCLEKASVAVPQVRPTLSNQEITENYFRIKAEIAELINAEVQKKLNATGDRPSDILENAGDRQDNSERKSRISL